MIEQTHPAAAATAVAAAASPAQVHATTASAASGAAVGEADAQSASPATRLTVEPHGDHYVYRLTDVATGRILLELPREDIDQLKDFAASTGAPLVSTRA